MQTGLLHLHNLLRWVILILLLLSIVKAYQAKSNPDLYPAGKQPIWLFTLIAAHITLLLGLYQWGWGRYGFFTTELPEGISVMKDKFLRFYWVEHPITMILAILLITLAYGAGKRGDFKRVFWFFLLSLIIILVNIPWPFRETVGRALLPGGH